MKKLIIYLSIWIVSNSTFSQTNPVVHGYTFDHRLVYVNLNLLVEYDSAYDILERAAASCYSGVVLGDGKILHLDIQSDFYIDKLTQFLDLANSLGLKVYPSSYPQASVLAHNIHLAEGLPVIDAPFIVSEDGSLINDPNDTFEFTQENFNSLDNWNTSDYVTLNNGKVEIAVQNTNEIELYQVYRQIINNVQPFRNYHVKFSLKVEDLDLDKVEELRLDFRVKNTNAEYRTLHYGKLKEEIKENNDDDDDNEEDYHDYHFTFNTLDVVDTMEIDFRCRSKSTAGTIYLDYIRIEPTGFNNIIRRCGAPVTILNKTKNKILTEGEGNQIDYIEDLMLEDEWPGDYSDWHPQPVIQTNTSLSDIDVGDQIEVSYYHAGLIEESAYSSLTHPEVFDITQNQFTEVRTILQSNNWNIFDGWFFGHDEIRVHGWDKNDACLDDQGSPGANLAYHFETLYNQVSNEKVIVWNDMFDPYVNAYEYHDGSGMYDWWTPQYYLVKERWTNSHANFPSDVIVLNWNRSEQQISTDINNPKISRIESAKFFDGKGNSQILGGFYDENLQIITDRILELRDNNVNNIIGVMYCTWENNFSQIEAWAEEIWGGASWCTSPPDCTSTGTNYDYTGDAPLDISVQNEISTTGTTIINSGSTVHLKAGNKIKLNAGFKINEGNNNIKMEITPCE